MFDNGLLISELIFLLWSDILGRRAHTAERQLQSALDVGIVHGLGMEASAHRGRLRVGFQVALWKME
jgi:hypothetical protein